MNYGPAIRRLRKARFPRQDGLAARLGCAPSTVARIESGKRAPSVEMLEAVAKAFGMKTWMLVMEAEEPSTSAQARKVA